MGTILRVNLITVTTLDKWKISTTTTTTTNNNKTTTPTTSFSDKDCFFR